VSNSSSSSFVCDVCGHDESGWDISLSDANMVTCANDHTFCEDHVIGDWDTVRARIEEKLGDDYDEYELRYEIPAEFCPICNQTVLTDHDFLRYLVKVTGITNKKALTQITKEFSNYSDFAAWLNLKE
jgi:hypothetical protein